MIDQEDCGTSKHILTHANDKLPDVHRVSWWSVAREAALGFILISIIVAVFLYFGGRLPGLLAATVLIAVIAISAVSFIIIGHSFGCSVKKSVVMVFSWGEYLF